jgi:ribosomal biogenesis protein LAS1
MVRDWFFPNHAKQDVFSAADSSSSHDMRQRAIDKVNLWLFKAGQLPPAIVATANMTEAVLHDESRQGSSGPVISETAMQSIYAMAFARFVNGFVDRDIARSYAATMTKEDTAAESEDEAATPLAASGKGESSMYAHAATIGMPQKFVDLRHQVTHGDVPSVAHLRKMTEQALEWLWERWWARYAPGTSEFAIAELEERRRISWSAREARQAAKRGSSEASDVGFGDAPHTDVDVDGS